MFEIVYTYDWYDGPRRGIADYQGKPHLFVSEWNDGEHLDADTFLLSSLDQSTFLLALEDWAIWRRWETAFHQGKTTKDTHPALAEDRSRYDELQELLTGRLEVGATSVVRMSAEFRVRNDPEWSGYGWHPLEVCWQVLEYRLRALRVSS